MKKYVIIHDFKEYIDKQLNIDEDTVVVLATERDRCRVLDVIEACVTNEEIEIESIQSTFESVVEFNDAIQRTLEKQVILRSADGVLDSNDFVDIPSLKTMLEALVSLGDVGHMKETYPRGFLTITEAYYNRRITEQEACKCLQIQRAQFYKLLKKSGVSRIKDS